MSRPDQNIKRHLLRFLPAWSELVGYPPSDAGVEGDSKNEPYRANLPPGQLGLPLAETPPNSVHGFYLGYKDVPEDIRELARYMETLLPGGVGVLHLPRHLWSKAELGQVCQGVGVRLKFISSTYFFLYPIARLYFLLRKRMYAPRLFLFRWLEKWEHNLLPFVQLPFGEGVFAVIERPRPGLRERTSRKLSVVIPVTNPAADFLENRLKEWMLFFEHYGLKGRAEILLITDGVFVLKGQAYIDSLSKSGELILVEHYREFGIGRCIRTGLARASGRRLLVDQSEGRTPAVETLDLIHPLLEEDIIIKDKRNRAKEKSVPSIGVVQGMGEDVMAATLYSPNLNPGLGLRLRKFYYGLKLSFRYKILGSFFPESNFRIYPARQAERVVEHARHDDRRFGLEEGIILGDADTIIRTRPVKVVGDVGRNNLKLFSVREIIREKYGPFLRYCGITFIGALLYANFFLILPPLLDVLGSFLSPGLSGIGELFVTVLPPRILDTSQAVFHFLPGLATLRNLTLFLLLFGAMGFLAIQEYVRVARRVFQGYGGLYPYLAFVYIRLLVLTFLLFGFALYLGPDSPGSLWFYEGSFFGLVLGWILGGAAGLREVFAGLTRASLAVYVWAVALFFIIHMIGWRAHRFIFRFRS